MTLAELYKKFLDAFFPERCVFCDKVTVLKDGVCAECDEKAERIKEPRCPKCGYEKKRCTCKSESHYYYALCAPFEYSGVVRHGIHLFKFDSHSENSRALSKFMAECVAETYPDVNFDFVTNVPMTKKSERARDYNQSALLAQGIAKELGLVYDNSILVKLYETKTQHLLSNLLRKGNLAGVFDVPDPKKVEGRTVLLVDDVSTTGQTLDECSKMLYLAGTDKIYCSVLALTQPDDSKKGDKTNARN